MKVVNTVDDPSDDEILARLAAQPDDLLRELFSLVDDLTPEDAQQRWSEPKRTATGALTMPFPIYSQRTSTIMRLTAKLVDPITFSWQTWESGRSRYRSAEAVAEAPPADAVRLVIALFRNERFCDGVIASAFADGRMQAALCRIGHWYREERSSR